jgi:type IV pilus assembly protein PilC
MPLYAYRAASATGRIQRGESTAAHEQELGQALLTAGLTLIEARPRSAPPLRWLSPILPLAARLDFFSQLTDLLEAGVKLPDAITSISSSEPHPALRLAAARVADDLQAGYALSMALARTSGLLTPVQQAMIEASEQDGSLPRALRQLAAQVQWQLELQQLLSRALRYPLFLLCVAFGVTSFMLLAVVPQVTALLQSLSTELPWPTRLLLLTANLFQAWWWAVPLLASSTLGGIVLLRRTSSATRLWLDRGLLTLPLAGRLQRETALARYHKTLAALLTSNLRLPEAMQAAAATMGNTALREQALHARDKVLAGSSLTNALQPLLDARSQQILLVGEQSSRLAPALDIISNHLTTRVKNRIDTMIGALEPILTVLVGGLLAWVVLAVLGPVYGSLAVLGRGL